MGRIKRCLSILLLLCVVGIGITLNMSAHCLTVTHYSLNTPKMTAPIRVVHLTDLHNSEFGKDNRRLVSLVEQQKPDLILMTGDMLNGYEQTTEVAERLVERLSQTAPVYFSYGNHEQKHEKAFDSDLGMLFSQAGAVVLEKEYADIKVKGQALRIGGMYGYALPEKYLTSGEAEKSECLFLSEFEQTQRLTVLLTHLPNSWILNDNLDEWRIDGIFCGHTHGGQIRIPKVGGVYAPGFDFFPGDLCGLYPSQDARSVMVLSRGLGTSQPLPRVNNVPEIVVVDFVPQEW